MKNKLMYIALAILIPLGYYVNINWGYLPFQFERFDKSFNNERIKIGAPIIEEYFLQKLENAKRRQVWYTPDSLKNNYFHVGKNYWTEGGLLSLEIDYYRIPVDSVLYGWLSREYHFKQDCLIYYYEIVEFDKTLSKIKLSNEKGDSILRYTLTGSGL